MLNSANGPPAPEPLMVLQLALLPDGNVNIVTPPQLALDSPERIALASFALSKVQTYLAQMGFPQPQSKVQAPPPGLRVPRNPQGG